MLVIPSRHPSSSAQNWLTRGVPSDPPGRPWPRRSVSGACRSAQCAASSSRRAPILRASTATAARASAQASTPRWSADRVSMDDTVSTDDAASWGEGEEDMARSYSNTCSITALDRPSVDNSSGHQEQRCPEP